MASALQNRLIGTIILVALVVIFLPDILDGEKSVNTENFVDVPAQPKYTPVEPIEDFDEAQIRSDATREVQVIEEVAVDDPEFNPDTVALDESTSEVSTKPESDSVGWVVQLGSFRHDKNVRELMDKLEKANYRSFSRKVQTTSGLLTKVFVGPEIDRAKLEAALPHLKEVTSLQGRITPFTVE